MNADVAAAERVLEAAVREAVALLRRARAIRMDCPAGWHPVGRCASVAVLPTDDEITRTKAKAEQTLLHAAHAAEPLLRGQG